MTDRDDKIKQARIEYLQSEIRQTTAAFEREMARVETRIGALQAEIDRLEASDPPTLAQRVKAVARAL